MDLINPWLTTRPVIYPRHWLCSPAPRCAILPRSGKRTKMFIGKLPSQSWKRTDLIARTSSTTRMTVVRSHPAALQRVTSCYPRLALQTRIHSCWILGTHYRRATNRGCINKLLLQSSIRSNRRRTQRLLWSSAWMQRVLTMILSFTTWPPKWRLRSRRSEALTPTSRKTTITRLTSCIWECEGAAGITKMEVTKETSTMPCQLPAGDDRPQLNWRGLTWEPVHQQNVF